MLYKMFCFKSGLFHGRSDFIKRKLLISEECTVPLYWHYHTLICSFVEWIARHYLSKNVLIMNILCNFVRVFHQALTSNFWRVCTLYIHSRNINMCACGGQNWWSFLLHYFQGPEFSPQFSIFYTSLYELKKLAAGDSNIEYWPWGLLNLFH